LRDIAAIEPTTLNDDAADGLYCDGDIQDKKTYFWGGLGATWETIIFEAEQWYPQDLEVFVEGGIHE